MEPLTQMKIMLATDLHYLSPELTDHGSYFSRLIDNSDGKVMEYSEELLNAFVYSVLEQEPDVLILTGDLTFNGAAQSHRDLAAKLQAIVDDGIPVLVIPGNHDLNNSNAAKFEGDGYTLVDSLSAEQFETLYASFGYDDAVARDTASLSYMWEASPQLRFLFLDVNGVSEQNTVPAETLRWGKRQLQQAQQDGVRVLAFSHQNLLQHSMFTDGYVISNSQDVLSLYEKYSVLANFSGHLHIQHIAQTADFHEVATSALSVAPNQYAKIELSGNALSYSTAPLDVSRWALLNGNTNTELLQFEHYARHFFYDSSQRQAAQELTDADMDAEQMQALADYFAEVNLAYFSGRIDTLPPQEKLLMAWQEQQGFLSAYLNSMAQEPAINQNELSIQFP